MWQTQPTFPLILQKSLNSISGNVITFLLNDRVCCKHLAVLQKSHEEQQPSSPHPHQGWAAQLPAAYFSKVITTGDALKQMIYQGSFLRLPITVLSGPVSFQLSYESSTLTSKSQAVRGQRSQPWGTPFHFFLIYWLKKTLWPADLF